MANNYILTDYDKGYFTNKEVCEIKKAKVGVHTRNSIIEGYKKAQTQVGYKEDIIKTRERELKINKINYNGAKKFSDAAAAAGDIYEDALVLYTASKKAEVDATEKFIEIDNTELVALKAKSWQHKSKGTGENDLYDENYVCPVFRSADKRVSKPKPVAKPATKPIEKPKEVEKVPIPTPIKPKTKENKPKTKEIKPKPKQK